MKKLIETIKIDNNEFEMILKSEKDGHSWVRRKIAKNILTVKQCYYIAYCYIKDRGSL